MTSMSYPVDVEKFNKNEYTKILPLHKVAEAMLKYHTGIGCELVFDMGGAYDKRDAFFKIRDWVGYPVSLTCLNSSDLVYYRYVHTPAHTGENYCAVCFNMVGGHISEAEIKVWTENDFFSTEEAGKYEWEETKTPYTNDNTVVSNAVINHVLEQFNAFPYFYKYDDDENILWLGSDPNGKKSRGMLKAN